MALRTTTDDDDSNSGSSLLNRIRKDPEYLQFRRIIKLEQSKLKVEEDIKEVLSLHASRTSRTIYDKRQYSPQAIVDATTMDLSFRSRMVELRVKASLHISLMQAAIGSIRKYIYTKYAKPCGAFTTEAARNSFIDTVLKNYISDVENAQSFIQLCDTLIKDIDQAGFSLKNMLECLKLLSETKGKIV